MIGRSGRSILRGGCVLALLGGALCLGVHAALGGASAWRPWILAGLAASLAGAFGLYLRRAVLAPLRALEAFVLGLEAEGGRDGLAASALPREFAPLRRAIEDMVGRFEARLREAAQSRAELAATEARYRGIFENAQEGIYLSTVDGRILEANPAMARFFGYESTEDFFAATPNARTLYAEPFDRNRFVAELKARGSLKDYLTSFRNKDGEALWFNVSARLVPDEQGRPNHIFGMILDVTERKRQEDELRRSRDLLADNQQKLDLAMGLVNMAVWEYDLDTGLFHFDDRFYSLFATTSDREGGGIKSPEAYANAFLPPEEAHMVADAIAQGPIHPGSPHHGPIEHHIIRRDGVLRHVAVHVSLLRSGPERGNRVVGTLQDITELKQAEEELRQSRDQLAAQQHKLTLAMRMASLCSWEYDFSTDCYTVDDQFFDLHDTSFDREGRFTFPADEFLPRFFLAKDIALIRARQAGLALPGGPDLAEPNEFHVRTATGRELIEVAQWRVIRDATGAAVKQIGASQDITERKMAEEALRASEASLARAQRIANMGNWDYDAGTGVLRWSAQMYRIHEVSPRDFVPSREAVLGLVHPEDREHVIEAVTTAETHNHPVRYSHRIVLPEGRTRVVEVQVEPIPDNDGVVRRLIGISQDITERKQAEDALRRSETRYRGLVESIPLGVAVISPQLRVLSLNAKMREWNPDVDLASQPVCHMAFNHPPSVEPCSYCPVTKALADGNIHESVTATPTKDGVRSFRVIACPVMEADGRVASVIEIVEDVTEKTAAEEAIRRSERKYRNLLDNLPLNVIYKDRDSTYLAVNGFYSHGLGLEPDQLIGMTDLQLFPEELARKYRDDDQRIMAAGVPEEYDEPFIQPDGEVRMVHTLKTPLRDEAGSVESILILFWDVTQERRAEAALRESEKMAAVGELASGVAHDFNNILGSIANLSQLVMDDLPDESEARGDLAIILASADMGKELVRQLLAFCRTGKLTRTIFDPAETIIKALAVLKPSIPDGIEVREDIPSGVGLIYADASQFRQVVLNLCANAVDAMRGRPGRLGVRLARESVNLENRPHASLEPGDYVVLRIEDTGEGMEPAVTARIFEPFFTTKPHGRGTGLGLAVVHGVAARHGGAVSVRSTPGQGSVFSVHFPVHEPREAFSNSKVGPSDA